MFPRLSARLASARRCPARAAFGYGDSPRCDRARGHLGFHSADRGMFDERWTEKRADADAGLD